MADLKTLKDFCVTGMNEMEYNDYSIASKEELRKEAIKWYHRSDGNKHKFIREFFNISEEELK